MQLVGGVAGAVIGSFFGMPQLGFAIGSALGGMAAQPSQPKPSVGSLAPTEVEYGWTIPRIFGTRRVPAWRLYQSELEAVAQRVEAKGSSSRTVGYRYRCNIGLLICRSGPTALVRIWRNKELVAVFRTDATPEQIAASVSSRHWQQAVFYAGSPDQLPHPAYEADLSPEPVPAYRGFCTLWLDGAWCEGRTPPAIEVEVSTGPQDNLGIVAWTLSTTNIGDETRAPGSVGHDATQVVPIKVPERVTLSHPQGGTSLYGSINAAVSAGYAMAVGAIEQTGETLVSVEPAPSLVNTVVAGALVTETYRVRGVVLVFLAQPNYYLDKAVEFLVQYQQPQLSFTSTLPGQYSSTNLSFDAGYASPGNNAAIRPGSSDVPVVAVSADTFSVRRTRIVVAGGGSTLCEHNGWQLARYVVRDNVAWLANNGIPTSVGYNVRRYELGSGAATHSANVSSGATVLGLACDGVTLYVHDGANVHPLNANDLTSAGSAFSAPGIRIFCNSAGNLYCFGSNKLHQRVSSAWVEVLDVTGGLFNELAMVHPPLYENGLLMATQQAANVGDNAVWQGIVSLRAVTPTGVALNTVLSNYWQACGVAAAQIDLSETAGITIDGYTAAGSGAYCTNELATACYFNVINTGRGLKTKLRGAASVGTIPYADLGVGVDQSADQPMEPDTDSAVEVPRRVSVSMANGAADHEVVTESDDRILGPNAQTDSISLALTGTPQKAKGIANTIAADRKTSGNTNKWSVGLKWIELELGDVVAVVGRRGETRRERLVRESFGDWVRAIETVRDRAADLQNTGVVTQAGASEPTLTVQQLGSAEVLPVDGPLLRDQDTDAGQYVAVDLRGGADFAAVYQSASSSGPYEAVGQVEVEARVGTLLTPLRAWNGQYTYDEDSTVDVLMADGATLTGSSKAAMSNDRTINVALIGSPSRGWELVRFVSATLIATNTYRLSTMLRAKRGTETLATAHLPGERFVLVDSTLRAVTLDIAQVGTRYWKAVAPGRNVATTTAVPAPYASVRTKPLAPTFLRATRDASGNAVFRVSPRTRFATRWRGAVYPNSELIERFRFEWFAYGFGVPVRVVTVDGRSAAYSAADQAADGISNPGRIAVRVSAVGPGGQIGYPLEAYA